MCRVDPTCKKILIAKGTIVGGLGYGSVNCSEGVFFEVKDVHTFWKYQMDCGNHVPLIYGRFRRSARSAGGKLGLGSSARIDYPHGRRVISVGVLGDE